MRCSRAPRRSRTSRCRGFQRSYGSSRRRGDNVAAPPKPNARPLVVRGQLVDDLSQGDGFLLRGAQGTTLLAMLMFLEGDTAQQLSVLAKVPNAVYLARGHAATDPKGKIHYEPSRCVFLYRLP